MHTWYGAILTFFLLPLVTFSALDDEPEKVTKPTGYTQTEDDDLDDLFDKQGMAKL